MKLVYICTLLLLMPFLIKGIILYCIYLEWAFRLPIPFSMSLFNFFKRTPQSVTESKKSPIGFGGAAGASLDAVPCSKKTSGGTK